MTITPTTRITPIYFIYFIYIVKYAYALRCYLRN